MAGQQQQHNQVHNQDEEVTESNTRAPRSRVVLPQILGIDGHRFRVNYDVPELPTLALYELWNREAKYEDIPKELLQYEEVAVTLGDYAAAGVANGDDTEKK